MFVKLILSENKQSYGLFELCSCVSIFTCNIAIIALNDSCNNCMSQIQYRPNPTSHSLNASIVDVHGYLISMSCGRRYHGAQCVLWTCWDHSHTEVAQHQLVPTENSVTGSAKT